MGLDAYIYKGEIKNRKLVTEDNETCYWRKNWDLENFISQEIKLHECGEMIELEVNDLVKIYEFLDKLAEEYWLEDKKYWQENDEESISHREDFVDSEINGILQLIGWLVVDKKHKVFYESDW